MKLFSDYSAGTTPRLVVATDFDTNGTMDLAVPNFGSNSVSIFLARLTGVKEMEAGLPTTYTLSQNYPNPFNPTTTIRYSLPSSAKVKLIIHDILGREIASLANEEQSAGWKEVQWNATGVASGVYFYKLEAAGNGKIFSETKKCVVVK